MITIKHLSKKYDNGVMPLKDFNATINNGDVITIIGPSGTGKSTLLRCINKLEKASCGEIWLDDQNILDPHCDITVIRRKIGMVFQSFNLFANMNIVENVMFAPMRLKKLSRKEAYKKAMILLERVGLSDKAFVYPEMLSGGQQQRVAIARTLAMEPEVILFDEPTSALDPSMVREVMQVIRDIAKTGTTMLIVTHEMKVARQISSRIFFVTDGILYEEGTPEEIFENPKNKKTIDFISQIKENVLKIELTGDDKFKFMAMTDKFAIDNRLDEKTTNSLISVCEEMYNIIFNELDKTNPMFNLYFKIVDKPFGIHMEAYYNGRLFSPLETSDELPLSILKMRINNEKYEKIFEENKEINKFICDILI